MPDENALLNVSVKMMAQNIAHNLFMEPDLNNEHTALCTHPLSAKHKKYFRKFQLWGLTLEDQVV